MNTNNRNYVIITPAYNEEKTIEITINSVLSQSFKPKIWVIVDDGSTDGTYEIIRKYAKSIGFIYGLRVKTEKEGPDFASKVNAFNVGYEYILSQNIDYDFIGNLDADIKLGNEYYDKILDNFANNSKLGISGGEVIEIDNNKLRRRLFDLDSVAGGVQLFRKECFEKVGGYKPISYGGIDSVAENTAKMHNWKVRTFTDIKVFHYGKVGSKNFSVFRSKFKLGIRNYVVGTHPIYMILKSIYRIIERPYLIGTLLMLCGYFFYFFSFRKKEVSKDYLQFLRYIQKVKILSFLKIETKLRQ